MQLNTVSSAGRRVLACVIVSGLICFAGALPARADAASGLEDFRLGRFSEAFQAWRAGAAQGDAISALYLGVMYDTGLGVTQDERAALAWYERAGEAGSVTAMFNAAVMHDAGRGVAADPAAALPWYERAVAGGSGRAAYDLGLIYESGAGVAADRARAAHFYRTALRLGIAAAGPHLRALGVSAAAGGAARVTVDPAIVSFERAQDSLLRRGVGDAAEAFALFRAAAEAGNALAAYNLAYDYEHGIGVPRDAAQAVVWYRRSEAGATDPAIRELARSGLRSALGGVAHAQR